MVVYCHQACAYIFRLRVTMVASCSSQQIELLYSLPGTAAIWLADGLKEKLLMEVPPPPARRLNTMPIPPPPTSLPSTTAVLFPHQPPIDKCNNQYTGIPPMPQRPTPHWAEGIDGSLRRVRIGILNAHGQRVDDNAALPQLLFEHQLPPDRPLRTRQTRAPPTVAAAVSTGQRSSSNTRCIKGLSPTV